MAAADVRNLGAPFQLFDDALERRQPLIDEAYVLLTALSRDSVFVARPLLRLSGWGNRAQRVIKRCLPRVLSRASGGFSRENRGDHRAARHPVIRDMVL